MSKFTDSLNEVKIKANKANPELTKKQKTYNKSITKKLARIKSVTDNLSGNKNPDWGHIGSLAHIEEELDNLLEGFVNY